MKKFVFVYYNGVSPEDTPPEKMQQVMADWGRWFEEIGDKLVDGGSPFADGSMSVSSKGASEITEADKPAGGYSIINAESMEEATEIAKGCPSHRHTDGVATVRVYEAMPM